MKTYDSQTDQWGGWGQYQSFIAKQNIPILNSPSQLTDESGNKDGRVQFSWNNLGSNVRYELYVDNNSGFGSPEISPNNIKEFDKNRTNGVGFSGTSYTISGNWLTPGYTYYCQVWAYYNGSTTPVKSETKTLVYDPYKYSSPLWAPLYRAFNKKDIAHFYCSSPSHLQIALEAKDANNQPIYVFEGIEGYLSSRPFATSETDGLQPIYRLWFYNKTTDQGKDKLTRHYYCNTSAQVDEALIYGQNSTNEGCYYEGIVGYTYKYYQQNTDLVKLHHTYLNLTAPSLIKDNFYTTSWIEYQNSINKHQYSNQNFLCYVSQFGSYNQEKRVDLMTNIGLINAFTGGTSHSENCFSIPIGIMNLSLDLNYNSISSLYGRDNISFGYGWTHNYSAYLRIEQNKIQVFWPNSSIHEYPVPSSLNIEYSPLSSTIGVYDRLIKIANDEFQIKFKDQSRVNFKILYSGDPIALLKSMTDRKGNTLTCYYDKNEWTRDYRLSEVAIPNNQATYKKSLSFTYYSSSTVNDKGRLIKEIIDNNLTPQRKVSFEYDDNSNLIKYTDVMSNQTTYSYDQNWVHAHLLTEVNLPLGRKITNLFSKDANDITKNNVSIQTIGNPNSSYSSTEYSKSGNTATFKNKLNNSNSWNSTYVKMEGNVPGVPTNIIKPHSSSTYEYTSSANPTLPTKISDGKGNATNITYDNMGNTRYIYLPLNATHEFQYNSYNDLISHKNPLGKTTTYSYENNSLGYLTSITAPFGSGSTSVTSFTYNTSGLAKGTIATIKDPLNRIMSYTYDNFGMLKSVTDPLGNKTTYDSYDGANRLTQMTVENTENGVQKNRVTKYVYESNDLIQTVTNVGDNSDLSTTYTYDALKNLTNVKDARGNNTQTVYQSQRNLIDKIINQENQITSFSYYDNGLTKSITKPNGGVINYGYDAQFRLASTSISNTSNNFSYTYEYDANDNILSISDNATRVLNFKTNNGNNYDALDRLTSYRDYFNNDVSYEYDVNNNIKKITYPGSNNFVTYDYWDDDKLKEVKWKGTTSIAYYTYKTDGAIESIKFGNNVKQLFEYDDAGRLKNMNNRKNNGSGDVINSYSFTLDNIGNHVAVNQIEPLTQNQEPSEVIAGISYNRANRTSNLNFDNNGNQTSSGNSNNYTYNFDLLNRLTSISGTNYSASYDYDAMGNRRAKTVTNSSNTTTTRYVLDINSDMSHILAETDGSNNPQWFYIHGGGLLARVKPDGTIFYYQTDTRGSVIAMTDANANVTHKYAYGEYGKVSNMEEPANNSNPFRYVGGYGVMDESNGLYNMRARYYDVASGRFLSEDPIWATNLYWYADGNPVMGIDPEGEWPELTYDSWLYKASGYLETGLNHVRTATELSGGIVSTAIGSPINIVSTANSLTAIAANAHYGFNDKATDEGLDLVYNLTIGTVVNGFSKGGVLNDYTKGIVKDIAKESSKKITKEISKDFIKKVPKTYLKSKAHKKIKGYIKKGLKKL